VIALMPDRESGSLRRTEQYASFLRISRALHLDVFDQPWKNCFFNNLLAHDTARINFTRTNYLRKRFIVKNS
jgi:hypothetical protein